MVDGDAAEVLAGVFDNEGGALDLVGDIASFCSGAAPGEVGLVDLGGELGHAGFGLFGGEVVDPLGDESEEGFLLGIGHGVAL